jgi:hypothetical protein
MNTAKPRIMCELEYEQVVLRGLVAEGIDPETAHTLINMRFPMNSLGLLQEGFGRGLSLTMEDLGDWITETLPGVVADDGTPIDTRCTLWGRAAVGEFIDWAIANERGVLSPNGIMLMQKPELLQKMFQSANSYMNN